MNVLIVDDSKAMRFIIARALREMGVPGAPYLEAPNGKVALQTVADAAPELIISDLNMPEMSGMQLLQALRDGGDATAFGFVTSEASAQLRQEAAQAGAQFVVTKPFTAANLSVTLGPVLAGLGCGTREVDSDTAEACLASHASFPTPAQIGTALAALLRRNVVASSAPVTPLPPNARIVAEYHSAEGSALDACAICDLGFALRAAASLTLIPSAAAEEAIRARIVEDTLKENLHEVLNVMARFFDHGGISRVQLGAVHLPNEKISPALTAQIAKPAGRMDLAVDVAGYGSGKLTLLSVHKTAGAPPPGKAA
jgi:two-component system chemotaxis response regulator CheY